LRIWRLSGILAIILFLIMPIELVNSQTNNSANNNFTCPNDLKKLSSLLLKDLPQYSNRVITRTQENNRQAGIQNYIIIANKAELEPLNLPKIKYHSSEQEEPQQIFFTVLERQYQNNKITNIQTYHWLFLVQTNQGWRMVMMFSRFGTSDDQSPPAPPIESTDGIIGQGVELWLRDCRAGTVRT
jgi:hypothetical protein